MTGPDPTVLREYEEVAVTLAPEHERTLRRLAGTRLTIFPGDARHTYRIKVSSYVGTLVAPGIRLLVRPKVPTANLFHLLEAGGRALTLGQEDFYYDTTPDLLAAFATFFARRLEASLTRGIPRRYEDQEDALVAIRGRVNLRALQRNSGLPLPVACSFDEYTADTPLNRVVKNSRNSPHQADGGDGTYARRSFRSSPGSKE